MERGEVKHQKCGFHKVRPPVVKSVLEIRDVGKSRFVPAKDLSVLPTASVAPLESAADEANRYPARNKPLFRKYSLPTNNQQPLEVTAKNYMPIVNYKRSMSIDSNIMARLSTNKTPTGAIDLLIRKRMAVNSLLSPFSGNHAFEGVFPIAVKPSRPYGKLADLLMRGKRKSSLESKSEHGQELVINATSAKENVSPRVENTPAAPQERVNAMPKSFGNLQPRSSIVNEPLLEVIEESAETPKQETRPTATNINDVKNNDISLESFLIRRQSSLDSVASLVFISHCQSLPSFDFSQKQFTRSDRRSSCPEIWLESKDEQAETFDFAPASSSSTDRKVENKHVLLVRLLRDWFFNRQSGNRDQNVGKILQEEEAAEQTETENATPAADSEQQSEQGPVKEDELRQNSEYPRPKTTAGHFAVKPRIYLSSCSSLNSKLDRLHRKIRKLLQLYYNVKSNDISLLSQEAHGEIALAVICYDDDYGNSDECQSEAMKLLDLKLPILFLKTDSNYQPKGWLLEVLDRVEKATSSSEDREKQPSLENMTISEKSFHDDGDELLQKLKTMLPKGDTKRRTSLPRIDTAE